jgi:hypothetical protein
MISTTKRVLGGASSASGACTVAEIREWLYGGGVALPAAQLAQLSQDKSSNTISLICCIAVL